MSKKTKIVLIIIASIFILLLVLAALATKLGAVPSTEERIRKFIVSNPLDLSQIEGFSRYRSCAGHDFRAPNLSGRKEDALSSMKHYVSVKSEFRGTIGEVKALAPFDGVISAVEDDFSGGSSDQQIWLTPDTRSPRQWHFIFFHITLADGLSKGSEVKVGQFICAANLRRGPDKATDNFDIAVKFTRPMNVPAIDAPFNHASEEVLAEYAGYGITEDDFIISEDERWSRPCPTIPDGEGPDVYFPSEAYNDDFFSIAPAGINP